LDLRILPQFLARSTTSENCIDLPETAAKPKHWLTVAKARQVLSLPTCLIWVDDAHLATGHRLLLPHRWPPFIAF